MSNVVVHPSDNNNWICWVLESRLVQVSSNSGHLLRRYSENNEDVFLLTKFSHGDNSAKKDNKHQESPVFTFHAFFTCYK
jgi:hypothetical protein